MDHDVAKHPRLQGAGVRQGPGGSGHGHGPGGGDPHDHHHADGDHVHGDGQAGHHHHHHHHHGLGGHSHVPAEIRHEKPLWWALGLTATVLLAELAGGWLTGSLALLSDAAHMATDVLALAIALVAVRLARRPPDARRTYGYARFEALGALANGSLLFVLAGYILWEAVQRVLEPRPVASVGMLAVAVLGLACNLVAMRLLHAGAGQSLNLKGAYLEVWSDMLGSLAVILAAVLIRLTGWYWVDPLLAVLLGLWVLPRTWVLLREAGNVLMEGVPRGVDVDAVRASLQTHPQVDSVHDLHVWALASRTPALTAHVVVAAGDHERVRRELAGTLRERHGIAHVTLQLESGREACAGCDGHGH
ncbi:cation diffusion facilitator family transporter [Pseudoxanthomonas taiwanensis]|uniref:cation diffusion facilitator family transporter n=1 Tax=Pseudoxanthomonas taiwanensis TaxID=176598 RepID=UPI001B86FD91